MDLKEKLRQIERNRRAEVAPHMERQVHPVENAIPGEILRTPFGSCFVHRQSFPIDYRHGVVPLSAALQASADSLALVAKDDSVCLQGIEGAVFLDTETTGLSGGVGTCAFLVGLGYFTGGGFHVEQFLMRDFHEEPACLALVKERIARCTALITFNGKSFDVPVLKSRMIAGRLTDSFDPKPHIDLLYPARRLWRHRIGSCALPQVESQVVGHRRVGDIPGALVPQLYFDYLQTGDARPLAQILRHNRDDLLSLVALIAVACRLFERPEEHATHPVDALAVGRTLEQMNRPEPTILLYRNALDQQPSHRQARELSLRLAFCYKRQGRWHEAVSIWERLIEGGEFDPLPFVELAKYYEHRRRDYRKAREIVGRALTALDLRVELRRRSEDLQYRQELTHRLRRLERKLTG